MKPKSIIMAIALAVFLYPATANGQIVDGGVDGGMAVYNLPDGKNSPLSVTIDTSGNEVLLATATNQTTTNSLLGSNLTKLQAIRVLIDIIENTITTDSQRTIITDGDGNRPDIEVHEGETSLKTVPGHSEAFWVCLSSEAISSATIPRMLIDLSNTGNWPHSLTHHIIIYKLIIMINPDANFAGDFEFGYLSNVDGDNGDFHCIAVIHLDKKADSIVQQYEFTGFGLDLETDHWFGLTTENDGTWQTDVSIPGPDGGSYPSGDGDFVMKVTITANDADVNVGILYTTVGE